MRANLRPQHQRPVNAPRPCRKRIATCIILSLHELRGPDPSRKEYLRLNEWGFAAEIKSWWDQELSSHPEWKIHSCRVEETVPGSRQRSDLFLQGASGPVLCGELRLPDHSLPSPWHPDNLLDAINKATTHGARWAFTSDSTEFLLIDTTLSGPPMTRVVQRVPLIEFTDRGQLDSPILFKAARNSWAAALAEVAPTVSGLVAPTGMPPDEVFINSLSALLASPVASIRQDLHERRSSDKKFESDLIVWMVDEQGWNHTPEQWDAELARAARLTAYVFTTRLMFYEALRRSQPALPPLAITKSSAKVVQATIGELFAEAREKSGDYETIFTWDSACKFALGSDGAVAGWARVIQHLSLFNLEKIGYDILGRLFERLIEPHERYRWGQHYTSPDVVDLMLSFAIPDGEGKVLDPAVGGGTFLVRAYVRKAIHSPSRTHQEILEDLYGLDVSAFAASLATVNVAARSLDLSENYPQIAVKSFFRVDPATAFMSLPAPTRTALGPTTAQIAIDRVRAITCNPPYVRLHELGRDRVKEAQRVLKRGAVPVPSKLHGLTNYHVYFWLHGAQFLEPGGRLVMITAGEWLDSDYGADLQGWLLGHFAIECFIESLAEPWFSEARVGTVVAVARLCKDAGEREANLVRFVTLRRELRDLYGTTADESAHLKNVDELRDRIMALPKGHGESTDMDWSTVPQSTIRQLGTRS